MLGFSEDGVRVIQKPESPVVTTPRQSYRPGKRCSFFGLTVATL